MDREQTASEAVPNAISDAISKIMANPEILSSVASMLGTSSPISAKASDAQEVTETEEKAIAQDVPSSAPHEAPPSSSDIGAVVSTLAPLLSGLSGSKKLPDIKHDDKRACLLRALKPYLSPSRREAIDYMISLSQISDLIKHIY